MPNLGDMVVRIVGDNSDFDAKIDASEKKFKKFGEDLVKIGKKLTTFVTLPLVGLGVAAVKSFADQETALKRLDSAIKLSGGHAAGASERMQDFAVSVMKATGVADELLENLISQALLMGRTEEEAKNLTQAAVDIAATGIMPLEQAFETLSVTYEGIGIRSKELRAFTGDLTEEQLRAGKAIDIVGAAVAGAGAEMRKTTAGGLQALKTSLGELGESLGAILAPAINNLIQSVTGIVDRFSALDTATKRTILVVAGITAAIGPLLFGLGKLIPVLKAVEVAIMTTSWASMATGIGLVVAAIAVVTVGIVGFVTAMQDAKKEVVDMRDQFPELNKKFFDLAPTATSKRIAEINARIAELKKGLKEAAESPFAPTDQQKKNIADANAELVKLNAELKTLQGTSAGTVEPINQVVIAQEDEAAATRAIIDLRDQSKEAVEREAAAAQEAARQTAEEEIAQAELVADRTAELRAAGEAGREAEHERELARANEVRDKWTATWRTLVTTLASLFQELANKQIDEIERMRDAAIAAADLQEQTTIERLKTELNAAIAANDEETVARLKAEIERETALAAINADFDKQRRKAVHDAAVAAKLFALAQVAIDTAQSVVAMLKIGPAGIPLSIAAGVIGALQAAVIAAQPIPPLAAGGIVMPQPGGVQATIAEAGQAEAVIPLDRLDSMLSRWPGSNGTEGDIHLQVMLDSRPIMEKIFPATRNRLVLIDAGAVV